MPTLAGAVLDECLRGLESQTLDDFEVVVIDNGSGIDACGLRLACACSQPAEYRLWRGGKSGLPRFQGPLLATLNDDAVGIRGGPNTLEDAEAHPHTGMFASEVDWPEPAA